jgi:beta-glucosidase
VLACEPTDVDWPPYKVQEPASNVPVTAMGWEICPSGLTDLLQQLHREYRLPPLLITENGMASDDQLFDGAVVDDQRLTYLQQHLSALERAMESGVNVRGYFAWSLMDNFEWAEGYRKRFGLVYVDYDSQERTLKRSGQWLQQRLLERKQRGVV